MDSRLLNYSGGNYFAHSNKRCLLRQLGKLKYYHLIKRQTDIRILVILHLFYMEAWPEIREYLMNLSPYSYSLVVTCMEGFYDEETLSSIIQFKDDAQIIKCENIGWDVLPFIIALRSIDLSGFDIVFKLQSKGTKRPEIFLYGQYFRYRDWFLNLFEGCIGPFTVHTTIRDLLDKRKNVGLIAARNLIVEDPIHKQHMVEEATKDLNLPYPKNYKFVAGTCFAVRASLLTSIQKLNIEIEKFDSKGFSFAHRMERIICFPSLWEGLEISGPSVLSLKRSFWVFFPFAWWWRKYNGVRILNDPQVHVDDVFAFYCIEPQLIKSFKFIDVKVGEIKRKLYPTENKVVSIDETLPYKYLVTRDPTVYDEYCEYNKAVWKTDVMSQKRFDELISSMNEYGDTQKTNIVIDENNIIWDGQHRCCWLLYNKGPRHIINALCLQRYYPQWPFIFRAYFSMRYRIPLIISSFISHFRNKV